MRRAWLHLPRERLQQSVTMDHAILTALGTDRPGIVDELSQFIFDRGGNIEDSRMVNLRGQFAIMVLVGGKPEVLGRIGKELPEFAKRSGLSAELRAAAAERPKGAGAAGAVESLPYRLVGTGIDQPGLVRRLAHLLREQNVNIESLETRLTPAPYTGAPMFELEALLSVPRTTSLSGLRQKLGTVCDEVNMDWDLRNA
jgi:glycine cleavage system transcriptional repressor